MPRQPLSYRRRRLIANLVALRKTAGLSQSDAARQIGWDGPRLSRVESGQIAISGDDVADLAAALGADPATTAALVDLARQSRKRGWWVSAADVLGQFSDFVELEEDARAVRVFCSDVIPGQLQTPAYTEAVIRSGYPDAGEEEITQRVQLRLDRQQRMVDHGYSLWVIIDEAALLRPIGGPAVMAEQLHYLAAQGRRPGIAVQILPTRLTSHPALGTPFTLIELTDGACFVHLESLTGGATVEGPEVTAYARAWEQLQALGGDFERSASIITQVAAEHRSTTHG